MKECKSTYYVAWSPTVHHSTDTLVLILAEIRYWTPNRSLHDSIYSKTSVNPLPGFRSKIQEAEISFLCKLTGSRCLTSDLLLLCTDGGQMNGMLSFSWQLKNAANTPCRVCVTYQSMLWTPQDSPGRAECHGLRLLLLNSARDKQSEINGWIICSVLG